VQAGTRTLNRSGQPWRQNNYQEYRMKYKNSKKTMPPNDRKKNGKPMELSRRIVRIVRILNILQKLGMSQLCF
jgi:hypothetical protein